MAHKIVIHIQTCIESKLMQLLDYQNR